MHPFPHHYVVTATARPSGDVPLAAEGLRVIESAMPKEFDGPGNQWSPESVLAAAVADCFVLTFRAVAVGFKFSWISLDVRTRLLEKAEASCLVTNSLSSDVHLTTEVTLG